MTGFATPPRSAVRTVRREAVPPGHRARSTDGRILYAIGDVHGCYDQLIAMFDLIVADIRQSGDDARPVILLCGDYIDRGPRSAEVMAALVWLERNAGVDIVLLKGNHEELLLDFLDRPAENVRWLHRDGCFTLRSYGVALPDDATTLVEGDCRALRDALLDVMPAAQLALLRRLKIRVTLGDYLFVHAGLRPGTPIDRQSDEDCLWIRDDFLKSGHRFDKVVVHGHSWSSDEPEIGADRMGIDTGVYETGVLTAVRLEGATVEVLQAHGGATGGAGSSVGEES